MINIILHFFKNSYEILCPNAIPKGFMDGKIAAQKMVYCF
jgi:hypothetical protein